MGQMVRSLGVLRSTGIGVAAMLGAGVFFVWAPAYDYAGSWLWLSLLLAATIATLNALVTTQLAISLPTSGGIYAFGRHYRGPFTGFLAGWMFLTGKTASVAAIALIAGNYLWPAEATSVAIALVAAGTVLTVSGIRSTATVSLTIAAVVTIGLVAIAGFSLISEGVTSLIDVSGPWDNPLGVVTAAGLLFFAFAGYARMATLAEEVVEPRKTLPRAIALALGIVLIIYALVAWSVLPLFSAGNADTDTPLRLLVPGDWSVVVTVLAVLACAGSLVAILAGLSRTALQMGREGDLPGVLGRISPKTGGPMWAEGATGVVAIGAVLFLDVTGLVALSGAGVLIYYAIGHWSAVKQSPGERLVPPFVPWVGLVMCTVLVLSLPWQSLVFAAASLAVGSVWFVVTHRRERLERP